VNAVLARLEQSRQTQLNIGLLCLENDEAQPILAALAAARQEQLYGFRFSCRAAGLIGGDTAELLRAAGVCAVELLPPSGPVAAGLAESIFLGQVTSVVALHQQGIDVTWSLSKSLMASATSSHQLVSLFPFLHHIPPPTFQLASAGSVVSAPPIHQAILEWRNGYEPHVLTYGRGPEFVRICDRRDASQSVKFATLRGAQAAVFMTATHAAPVEVLEGAAGGVPMRLVRRFLENLVHARLMCRTSTRLYLSLPTRRRIEERWVEGDT
jgi:hypothetical protein